MSPQSPHTIPRGRAEHLRSRLVSAEAKSDAIAVGATVDSVPGVEASTLMEHFAGVAEAQARRAIQCNASNANQHIPVDAATLVTNPTFSIALTIRARNSVLKFVQICGASSFPCSHEI